MRSNLIKKTMLGVSLGLLSHYSSAVPITFVGTSGSLNASATFSTSGANLIVALANTSAVDVTAPGSVLTGVFFTLAGDPTLGRVSAVLNGGSSVFYDADGQPAGGVVGGEWAYVNHLAGAPGGADEGISSSGLGLFGAANFPGADLAGPPSGAVNGVQYGLLSAGDNTASGNGGITGSEGLIKNSVIFTLSGLPSLFDPGATGAITRVSFQYGTDLREPNVPGVPAGTPQSVPEPGVLGLLGAGLFGALRRGRRRQIAPVGPPRCKDNLISLLGIKALRSAAS
jgi:hypothetical protein